MPHAQSLIEKLFNGEPRAVARAITKVENGTADAAELMKAVFRKRVTL
jgi:putative protein kinase ArgK-like GTPase of G3E family